MENPKILVVDDSRHNLDFIIGALKTDYRINVATNGPDGIRLAQKESPSLILLDVMMPKMDGYEVLNRLQADTQTRDIPVIFLTALDDDADEEKGLENGAVDYITKPFNPRLLKRRIKNHIALKEHQTDLEQMVARRTRMLNLTQDVTIEIAGNLAEYRDPETGFHIKRTRNIVKTLALRMRQSHADPKNKLDDNYIDLLVKSAPLHDIGKVGIPDRILLKPGRLEPEEFESMKQHTVYGRDIIAASEKRLGAESFLRIARKIAFSHHEKWDGSGYPQGLRGSQIPLSGRLMALADVYDALCSRRVYKDAFTHEQAVKIIRSSRGSHFDPQLTDLFILHEKEFQNIAKKYPDPEGMFPSPGLDGQTRNQEKTASSPLPPGNRP